MTDLELAQQALPVPDFAVDNGGDGCFYEGSMLDMFLAGMAKAREIDAGICEDAHPSDWPFLSAFIRSQGKK
jgi:hypothetical protein